MDCHGWSNLISFAMNYKSDTDITTSSPEDPFNLPQTIVNQDGADSTSSFSDTSQKAKKRRVEEVNKSDKSKTVTNSVSGKPPQLIARPERQCKTNDDSGNGNDVTCTDDYNQTWSSTCDKSKANTNIEDVSEPSGKPHTLALLDLSASGIDSTPIPSHTPGSTEHAKTRHVKKVKKCDKSETMTKSVSAKLPKSKAQPTERVITRRHAKTIQDSVIGKDVMCTDNDNQIEILSSTCDKSKSNTHMKEVSEPSGKLLSATLLDSSASEMDSPQIPSHKQCTTEQAKMRRVQKVKKCDKRETVTNSAPEKLPKLKALPTERVITKRHAKTNDDSGVGEDVTCTDDDNQSGNWSSTCDKSKANTNMKEVSEPSGKLLSATELYLSASEMDSPQIPSHKSVSRKRRQRDADVTELESIEPYPSTPTEYSVNDFVYFDKNGLSQTSGLDLLKNYGVTENIIAKLKASGYPNVESVRRALPKRLQAIKGLNEKTVENILKAASNICPDGFTTASDIFQKRSQLVKISTGSKELDQLLGGGIEMGSLTEFYGKAGTGKTQLCYSLLVNNLLGIDNGGSGSKSMYIHCKPDFCTKRLLSFCENLNLNPEDVLDKRIYAVQAKNSDMLSQLISDAIKKMQKHQIGLLVVDSPILLFRTEYHGRGELQPRQAALGQFLQKLKSTSNIYNTATVITNEVYDQVDGMMSGVVAQGGNVMAHNVVTRVKLSRGPDKTRICEIINSPNLPAEKCSIRITENGIEDAE